MLVAVTLGILVGVASLVSAVVLLLTPAVAVARFLRGVREPASVVMRAVPHDGSRPSTLLEAQP
jgi:hypothetical protein